MDGEDFDFHRQPALYFISQQDMPSGPHLIVDWNGPPTDYDEFNIDLLSNMVHANMSNNKKNNADEKSSETDGRQSLSTSPSAMPKLSPDSNRTLLKSDDDAKFDFLTVTPMVKSVVLRSLRHEILNTTGGLNGTENIQPGRESRDSAPPPIPPHKKRGPFLTNGKSTKPAN